MKIIKLKLKNYDYDLHFGLPEDHKELECEKKLHYGFTKIKPWLYCIPYYEDSSVAFVSKDAILTFLYDVCKLTKEEIKELNEIGYYLEYYKTPIVDTGFSKLICTFKLDEINKGPETDSIKKLARKQAYNELDFIANIYNTKESNRVKNLYYNKVKSNF